MRKFPVTEAKPLDPRFIIADIKKIIIDLGRLNRGDLLNIKLNEFGEPGSIKVENESVDEVK